MKGFLSKPVAPLAAGISFGLLCELATPAPWNSWAMAVLSVATVAALLLLTHALLRLWALVLWVPFLVLILFSAYIRHYYNLTLDPYLLSQIIGASPQDVEQWATAGNLGLFLLLVLLCAGIMLAVLLPLRRAPRKPELAAGALLLALCTGAGYALPEPCLSRTPGEGLRSIGLAYRIPWSFQLAAARNTAIIQKLQALPSPAAQPGTISTLHGGEGVACILHIGESVRADHLGINGYARNTTPWLAQVPGLVNFRDCTAISTLTTNSMLTILTDARGNMEREISPQLDATTGCVMDLFAAHGFTCYGFFTGKGRDRNETWGSTFERLQAMITTRAKRVYECGEDYMPRRQLPQVAEALAESAGQNRFLLINNVGSHSPFFAYDHANPPFTPASEEALHQSPRTDKAAAEQVANAYDNTLVYTDAYIRDLLEPLKGMPYIYIYISDHGEPVGENNEWTRGNPDFHRYQWCRVPLLIIASPEFEALHPHFRQAMEQLRQHTATPCAHENIFHTLLGVFGISTPYYRAELDLGSPALQPYRGPHPSRNGQSADGLKWE